jgi:hypothetical protein
VTSSRGGGARPAAGLRGRRGGGRRGEAREQQQRGPVYIALVAPPAAVVAEHVALGRRRPDVRGPPPAAAGGHGLRWIGAVRYNAAMTRVVARLGLLTLLLLPMAACDGGGDGGDDTAGGGGDGDDTGSGGGESNGTWDASWSGFTDGDVSGTWVALVGTTVNDVEIRRVDMYGDANDGNPAGDPSGPNLALGKTGTGDDASDAANFDFPREGIEGCGKTVANVGQDEPLITFTQDDADGVAGTFSILFSCDGDQELQLEGSFSTTDSYAAF